MVSILLDTGEVNVNAVNENGEIPFTIAEGTVNYAIYKATTRLGLCSSRLQGLSRANLAIGSSKRSDDTLKLLLETARDHTSRTPLVLAVCCLRLVRSTFIMMRTEQHSESLQINRMQ
jgi:hypothetical protein